MKIVDRDPGGHRRRLLLWECFGLIQINPTDIKDGRGAYYAIIPTNKVEHVITDEVKEIFRKKNFEIITPIEFNSLKSIIVRHIDKAITEYTREEMIAQIQAENDWIKVEDVVHIGNTGRLLKIRLKSVQMVTKALQNGMIVMHQWIPARNIEKEIYVKITPCYNCYAYNHKTADCNEEKTIKCAYCSLEGHKQNQCNASQPKCINCGGRHRTLAAACQIRKDIIKNKAKELRDRSRSRSRAKNPNTQQQTYASATAGDSTASNLTNLINNEDMKNMVAKITTAIVFGQCIESFKPGTFQQTVNDMFDLNGLPRMRFPTQKVTEGIRNLYKDMLQTSFSPGVTDINTRTNEEGEKEDDTEVIGATAQTRTEGTSWIEEDVGEEEEESMEIHQTSKRGREDKITPNKSEAKKTKNDENANTSYKLPDPIQASVKPKTPKPTAKGDETEGDLAGDWVRLYVRKSEGIEVNCRNQEKRERLRKAIESGRTKIKIHWRIAKYSYEIIFGAIIAGKMKLRDSMFKKVNEEEFAKIQHKFVAQFPSHI